MLPLNHLILLRMAANENSICRLLTSFYPLSSVYTYIWHNENWSYIYDYAWLVLWEEWVHYNHNELNWSRTSSSQLNVVYVRKLFCWDHRIFVGCNPHHPSAWPITVLSTITTSGPGPICTHSISWAWLGLKSTVNCSLYYTSEKVNSAWHTWERWYHRDNARVDNNGGCAYSSAVMAMVLTMKYILSESAVALAM